MFQTDSFSLIALFVGMSLLPFLAMVATSYLKIVGEISLVRNALGVQSIPPNMVVNAIALILSFYVMAPVVEKGWDIYKEESAINKVEKKQYDTQIAMKAAEPMREWLIKQTDEKSRAFFVSTAEQLWAKDGEETAEVNPDSFFILIPSFCVSELTKAF